MTTEELLVEARKRLLYGWNPGQSRDATTYGSSIGVSIRGALALNGAQFDESAWHALYTSLPPSFQDEEYTDECVEAWELCDDRSHDDVIRIFDQAIRESL